MGQVTVSLGVFEALYLDMLNALVPALGPMPAGLSDELKSKDGCLGMIGGVLRLLPWCHSAHKKPKDVEGMTALVWTEQGVQEYHGVLAGCTLVSNATHQGDRDSMFSGRVEVGAVVTEAQINKLATVSRKGADQLIKELLSADEAKIHGDSAMY